MNGDGFGLGLRQAVFAVADADLAAELRLGDEYAAQEKFAVRVCELQLGSVLPALQVKGLRGSDDRHVVLRAVDQQVGSRPGGGVFPDGVLTRRERLFADHEIERDLDTDRRAAGGEGVPDAADNQ